MFLTEIRMKWHGQKILLCLLPIYSFCPHKNTRTAIINHCPQSGTCVNWFLVPCKCWSDCSKTRSHISQAAALELQNLYQSFKKCSFHHDPEASIWACGDRGCNSVNSTTQISAVDFDPDFDAVFQTVSHHTYGYRLEYIKSFLGHKWTDVCHFSFQFMFNCFYMHVFGAILQ